jgi:hypothetical protein
MDPDLVFRARLRDDGARSILVVAAVIIAAVVTVGLLPESSGGGQGGPRRCGVTFALDLAGYFAIARAGRHADADRRTR